MSVLKLLAGLRNSKLKSLYVKKKVEETSEVSLFGRLEGDWCAEDPRSWYKDHLSFLKKLKKDLKNTKPIRKGRKR